MKAFLLILLFGAPTLFAAQTTVDRIPPDRLTKTWKRMIGTNVYDLRPVAIAGGTVKGGGTTNQWRPLFAQVISPGRGGVFAQEGFPGKGTAGGSVEGARFFFIRNAPPVIGHDRKPAVSYLMMDYVFPTTNRVTFTYKGGTRTAIVADYGRVIAAPDWIP